MLVQVKARGDTFGGLEHLGCLSIFHSSNFCLNCQKRWYLACTRCNLDKRSQIKFFRLPKITNQLYFSTKATGQHIPVLTDCITITILMRTIHPLLLAKKIPFTYSKPQVIRLMPQIPQRHFPKDRLSQGKTQSTRTRNTIASCWARHRHRRICKSSLLKRKHWPSTEGGTHGARRKNWCDFFGLFYEVFPKQKWKCFRNKNKNFLKRKCFYSENICETKVFSKRK